MTWTDERVETLKKLWTDGLSASQIAAELGGITRNAVIGKVHRLGLSGRAKSPSSAAPRPRKPRPHQHMMRVLAAADRAATPRSPMPMTSTPSPSRSWSTTSSRSASAGRLLELDRGDLPLADRRSRARPTSSSAAAGRSPACPIAPITRASPTSRPTCAATGGRSAVDRPPSSCPGLTRASIFCAKSLPATSAMDLPVSSPAMTARRQATFPKRSSSA